LFEKEDIISATVGVLCPFRKKHKPKKLYFFVPFYIFSRVLKKPMDHPRVLSVAGIT